MKQFICVGSRTAILGVGEVSSFGGSIELPDELADIWKADGGPVVVPAEKFTELDGDRSSCREYLHNVRLGGNE